MSLVWDGALTTAVGFGLAMAVSILLSSLFVEAPYGKLGGNDSIAVGKIKIPELSLNPRLGWFLMELPATVSFTYFYFQGPNAFQPLPLVFAALFYVHYANRGFYFPYNIRVANSQAKQNYSLVVVVMGWVVTGLHGYISGRWYSDVNTNLLSPELFLQSPSFLLGFLVYEFGFWFTVHSEAIVRNLRTGAPGEAKYKIPRGGGFEYVTNAPYFFELTAWLGFALMTLNPGGVVIFCISFANLVPRAFTVHKWYQDKFKDEYPKERKVIVPFII
ncbi:hypothetical protein BASA81_001516 [Batrachochytrium salamandrivorans]|nr:hypothetical protein BASA81_001516 [Batrachochytrium salamandrivorans]